MWQVHIGMTFKVIPPLFSVSGKDDMEDQASRCMHCFVIDPGAITSILGSCLRSVACIQRVQIYPLERPFRPLPVSWERISKARSVP